MLKGLLCNLRNEVEEVTCAIQSLMLQVETGHREQEDASQQEEDADLAPTDDPTSSKWDALPHEDAVREPPPLHLASPAANQQVETDHRNTNAVASWKQEAASKQKADADPAFKNTTMTEGCGVSHCTRMAFPHGARKISIHASLAQTAAPSPLGVQAQGQTGATPTPPGPTTKLTD